MIVLRNFLYLDTRMLDDYLATIEGYTFGEHLDRKEKKTEGKGAKAGARFVEGKISRESEIETRQRLSVPDVSRFQHFYSLLSEEGLIEAIDLFDEEYWQKLMKDDILEIEANIIVPQMLSVFQAVDEFSPLIDLMQKFGQDPLEDESSREAFSGISELSRSFKDKPIPLSFHSISTPGYSFGCKLVQQNLKVSLEDLQGHATVFGKVLRKIPKGNSLTLFSLMPALLNNLPSMSQQEKTKMERDMAEQELAEVLSGPGILISPLAVYR